MRIALLCCCVPLSLHGFVALNCQNMLKSIQKHLSTTVDVLIEALQSPLTFLHCVRERVTHQLLSMCNELMALPQWPQQSEENRHFIDELTAFLCNNADLLHEYPSTLQQTLGNLPSNARLGKLLASIRKNSGSTLPHTIELMEQNVAPMDKHIALHRRVSSAYTTPCGTLTLLGYQDGSVQLYEHHTASLYASTVACAVPVTACCIAPSQRCCYVGAQDGTLVTFAIADNGCLARLSAKLPTHRAAVSAVVLNK